MSVIIAHVPYNANCASAYVQIQIIFTVLQKMRYTYAGMEAFLARGPRITLIFLPPDKNIHVVPYAKPMVFVKLTPLLNLLKQPSPVDTRLSNIPRHACFPSGHYPQTSTYLRLHLLVFPR